MYFVVLNKRNTCTRLKIVWTGFENMRIIKGGGGEVCMHACRAGVLLFVV